MMYIHYCKSCQHIHILNGHKPACPKCGRRLTELRITYQEYSGMNTDKREHLLAQCCSAKSLAELEAPYRMYKYSKWYKNLQQHSNITS